MTEQPRFFLREWKGKTFVSLFRTDRSRQEPNFFHFFSNFPFPWTLSLNPSLSSKARMRGFRSKRPVFLCPLPPFPWNYREYSRRLSCKRRRSPPKFFPAPPPLIMDAFFLFERWRAYLLKFQLFQLRRGYFNSVSIYFSSWSNDDFIFAFSIKLGPLVPEVVFVRRSLKENGHQLFRPAFPIGSSEILSIV